MATAPTNAGTIPDSEARHRLGGAVRAIRSAGDNGSVKLAGHAAVYDQRSDLINGWFFEFVRRGAFAQALNGKNDVRFLIDHDSGRVMGRSKSGTLKLGEDSRGLTFEVDLPNTQEARDLAVSIERGDISEMSFGFRTIKDTWREVQDPGTKLMYWERSLEEVELFDVSAVAYPAYPATDVAKRSLEQWRSKQQPPMSIRDRHLRLIEAEA